MEKFILPIPAKRYFTIGEASDLCGVKPHVLRYWEQEFKQLRPMKRRGNRRYYQHHEVLVIRKIREWCAEQSRAEHGPEHSLDPPHFILTTAYDQYAIEAFRLEALDYILKPVDKDRLAEAIDRAQRVIGERAKGLGEKSGEDALPSTAKPALQRTKVLVRAATRNYIVDAADIVYATIDDGLISIVTTQFEGISNYRTIEELQGNLDPETFWRVHRSYLVNINRIKEVIPWFKSSFQLRMDDKKATEIPVSRVQTKRLRTLLKL